MPTAIEVSNLKIAGTFGDSIYQNSDMLNVFSVSFYFSKEK